jgi:hypothetical protein
VHFHVALRLDGPADRESPPAWVTSEVLVSAIVSAAATVAVPVSVSEALGEYVVRFGAQLDARPIVLGGADLPPERPAGYMAKYATKGTGPASCLAGDDHPVGGAITAFGATFDVHVEAG